MILMCVQRSTSPTGPWERHVGGFVFRTNSAQDSTASSSTLSERPAAISRHKKRDIYTYCKCTRIGEVDGAAGGKGLVHEVSAEPDFQRFSVAKQLIQRCLDHERFQRNSYW
jgi:hypothetical protein